MKEKRKFVRLGASLELRYKDPDTEEEIKALTRNISGGGLRFFSKKRLEKGSELELTLSIPGHEKPIRATGEVCWIKEPCEEGDERHDIGLKFINIDSHDMNKIFEYIYATGMN